ncbi:MAG: hypothetical protein OWV35_07075, partial [Firmicutes bacterium]|nr:hypothetical protein [Bacillota bacterium]
AGWVVAPAAGWDYAAGGDREFLAYPEALEADPLALLGLAFVWAGTDAARWCRLIPRLGPLVGPAVLAGAPAAQAGAVLAAWAGRYPQAEVPPGVRQAWAAAGGGEVFAACAWPAWPDTGAERAMLEAGLVPHGADGQPPPDPLPVLAASAGLAPAQRVETLGLVAKALESWELGRRWAAARAAEEAGRHGLE